jgi:hypothetical protein
MSHNSHTWCCVPYRNADVEEQIGHLRAQLLRSEQDKDLMRVKLEEETAEREKAQKQVSKHAAAAAASNTSCVLLQCALAVLYVLPLRSVRGAAVGALDHYHSA